MPDQIPQLVNEFNHLLYTIDVPVSCPLTFCICSYPPIVRAQTLIEKNFGSLWKTSQLYDVVIWETTGCNAHIVLFLGTKYNQTMKFSQLIQYDMKNGFLEKSYTKCGGETSPRPFSKK